MWTTAVQVDTVKRKEGPKSLLGIRGVYKNMYYSPKITIPFVVILISGIIKGSNPRFTPIE